MIVEIPSMVPGVLIGCEIRPLWEMVNMSMRSFALSGRRMEEKNTMAAPRLKIVGRA